MINQEKRPFRIRDKYIDRDSEYLLQENEPDAILDQQLLEDLQKKKTDLRYIEMQVMEGKDFFLSSLLTLDKNVFMVRGSCLISKWVEISQQAILWESPTPTLPLLPTPS